jgi:hypothetical protein
MVPEPLLKKLLHEFEQSTELSPGGLRYKRLDFLELYEILPDAFTVKPRISRSEAIGLFRRALIECRRAGTMTGDSLIASASALQKASLAVPQIPFTLWTKLRATNTAHSPSFTLSWRDVRLRSAATLPKWLHREEYFLNGVGRIHPREPEGYGYLILTCKDRDEARAVNRMMDALQLILGLLNMIETWGRHSHWGGRNWTEGKLWPGPNQFVFRKRKFLGEERIWYNPDYDDEAWNRQPLAMKRVLEVVPMARRALAALDPHPFADVLVRALTQLQDGFAARESSHRLLRYWSALEQLYVEPDAKGGSNDKILDRAVFAELDPDVSRWKLEHIARLRNDYVHAGVSGDDHHAMCQFLRELVARHINHWIFQGHELGSHAALLSFVKLPSGRGSLVHMRAMIDRRIRYLDGKPATEADTP